MPLSLDQYAEMLDDRGEPRPAPPDPVPVKAKPHVKRFPAKAVIFSGYGSLMVLAGREPQLLNEDPVMRKIALEKTIEQFNMWPYMTRKPGHPADQMAATLQEVYDRRYAVTTANHAETRIDAVWRGVVDRLVKKEYKYDAGKMGDLDALAEKITYYYLMRSQGVGLFPHAAGVVCELAQLGVKLGIHGNGQVNAPVQLLRCLADHKVQSLNEVFDPGLCLWSCQTGVRSRSEKSALMLQQAIEERRLEPADCLYFGVDMDEQVIPAKNAGFRTALFMGDQSYARANKDQLKDPKSKPDMLLTSLDQLLDVFG